MNLSEETYRMKNLMGLNLLNEGLTISTTDEWCKANLTDLANQICIIRTPQATGQKQLCQTATGNAARQQGYANSIIIDDTSTPNFCKTIWGKIAS